MEGLKVAATKSSPEVCFDAEDRIFRIAGESYPEDTAKFFIPLFDWLEEYLGSLEPDRAFVLTLDIPYCNSSSTKVLMDLLYLLDKAASNGREVKVNWVYDPDNDNAIETGEELVEDIEFLSFHLVKKRF